MQATLPTLLTLDQASIVLNLSPSVILEHTETGNIPGQKIGNTWHYSQSELEAWSDRHDQRKILLRQAGAFAHDETLEAFQLEIDRQRQLNTIDSIG
jgi:Helix-turn-helix domain